MKKQKQIQRASLPTDETIHAAAITEGEYLLEKYCLSHLNLFKGGARDALGNLKRDVLHREKMTHEEAAVLARRMYEYIERILPELGITKGSLCAEAFSGHGDSKELSRLTLASGAVPKEHSPLRVNPQKYLLLIQALAKLLKRSESLVADEILRGTKYHPLSWTGEKWSTLEKVQLALQNIVNKLDQEFDWSGIYRKTAELKCQAVLDGSTECWPLWSTLHDFKNVSPDHMTPENWHKYQLELKISSDITQAYFKKNASYGGPSWADWMQNGCDTDQIWNDDFFYVPHAPIGFTIAWELPDKKSAPEEYRIAVEKELIKSRATPEWLTPPTDHWNENELKPEDVVIKDQRDNNYAPYFYYHAWIIAYPHPNDGRLFPTLFCNLDDGNVYILPLVVEVLAMLENAVWYTATENLSVLEHLKNLLVDIGDDNMNPIERALRRTGPWLAHNPILKLHTAKLETDRKLDALLWKNCRK